MAAYEENLQATISGDTSELQSSLTRVKNRLESVSDKADGASRSVGKLSAVFEGAEESAEGYEDTIGDIAEHLTVAAKAFDEFGDEARETVSDTTAAATAATKTSGAIDNVGDEAIESAAELKAYNAAVSSVFGGGALSSGPVSSVLPGKSGGEETGDGSGDVASGRTSLTRAREAVQGQLGSLVTDGGREPIDYSELESLETQLSRMPNISFGRGQSADELADSLALGSRHSEKIVDNLDSVEDIDEIIGDTVGVSTLSGKLSAQGEGQRASQFKTVTENRTLRSIIEPSLRSASNLSEFQQSVRQTRRRTDALVGELNDVPDPLSDVTDEAAEASQNIEEFGDQVRVATKRSDDFDGKLRGIRGILKDIADTASFRLDLGPINVKLERAYGLLVLLYGVLISVAGVGGALASALGAAATSAAGLVGVLGGVAAGGLMQLGERRANLDPTDDVETMGDGVKKVMEDVKKKAVEAMAPLRNPQTASFTMGLIGGGLTQLNRLATLAADLFDEMQPLIDTLSATWWETEPYILQEMRATILALQPEIEALVTGAIQALPGLFRYMRTEGKTLLDTLMAFGASFIDTLPIMTSFATAILRIVVPAFTLWQSAIGMLEPVLWALLVPLGIIGDIVNYLANNTFVQMVVAAKLLSTWLTVMTGVVSAMPSAWYLLGAAARAAQLAVGSFWSALLGPIGWAITAILAVISVFDLWDETIKILQQTWNTFVNLMVGWWRVLAGIFDALQLDQLLLGKEIDSDQMFGNMKEQLKVDEDGTLKGKDKPGNRGGGSGYKPNQQRIDMSNSTFYGGDAVKQAAKEALQEAQDEQRMQTSPFN